MTHTPSTRQRRWVLAALMATMMLAAMDITIVSTAIPQIVSDLGGFTLFTWVFSIYLLAQTVTIPIYGKLADLFGRKPVLIAGTLVFLIGSAASAIAWSMVALIVFRGLQGLGAGSIMATVNTLAGDLYSVQERARIQGWLSSVWAVAAIAGPTLGGAFAEYLSWRWIFLINLPIGVVALALIGGFLREQVPRRRHRIDFAGAGVVLLAVGTLIFGLLQGGLAWPWVSWPSLAVFAGAGYHRRARGRMVRLRDRGADPPVRRRQGSRAGGESGSRRAGRRDRTMLIGSAPNASVEDERIKAISMENDTLQAQNHAPEAAAPFGTVFSERMTISRFADGCWTGVEAVPVAPLSIHPGAHVLHYASTCFEGLKAFRMPNGAIRIFRLERHLARFHRSAELLCLPIPSADVVERMVRQVVKLSRDDVPVPPGALYLRPTLIGTEANVGAAGRPSSEALLYVLASPVGDYFAGGGRPLTILIEDHGMRSTPGFGQAKTGGNYASALRHVVQGRAAHGADQVLFCPNGDVQETGASNFFLLDDRRLMTKPLDGTFLHGVTRDSVIALARHLGYEVIERNFTVAEIKDWIRAGEAALSGTAAVLAGVGTFIHDGTALTVGDGGVGPNTLRLREALTAIQTGAAEDRFAWLT